MSQLGREGPRFPLLVPFLHPGERTDGFKVLVKELAGLVLLPTEVDAAVKVHVVLPTVPVKESGRGRSNRWTRPLGHSPRLILVGEPGIVRNGLPDDFLLLWLLRGGHGGGSIKDPDF